MFRLLISVKQRKMSSSPFVICIPGPLVWMTFNWFKKNLAEKCTYCEFRKYIPDYLVSNKCIDSFSKFVRYKKRNLDVFSLDKNCTDGICLSNKQPVLTFVWNSRMQYVRYRTRSVITRGLYTFYPIFHCGLYCRAVSITDNLCSKVEIV